MTIESSTFEHAVAVFHDDLSKVRANEANPALLDDVRVTAYETQMALRELASISTPDAHTLLIEPWDKSLLKAIEKALQESDLGMQPVVDSDRIRLTLPALTEETRRELVKGVHEKAEVTRVRLRKIREEDLKKLKTQEKAGEISEDEYFAAEKEMQKTMDMYNGKVKELVDKKEKELMTI